MGYVSKSEKEEEQNSGLVKGHFILAWPFPSSLGWGNLSGTW